MRRACSTELAIAWRFHTKRTRTAKAQQVSETLASVQFCQVSIAREPFNVIRICLHTQRHAHRHAHRHTHTHTHTQRHAHRHAHTHTHTHTYFKFSINISVLTHPIDCAVCQHGRIGYLSNQCDLVKWRFQHRLCPGNGNVILRRLIQFRLYWHIFWLRWD
jgi:ABC-type nickel/cobalt efflux system permease component RcnA